MVGLYLSQLDLEGDKLLLGHRNAVLRRHNVRLRCASMQC